MVPIITHPERNQPLLKNPEMVLAICRAGCLVQVTANAVTGSWGSRSQKMAEWLLKRGRDPRHRQRCARSGAAQAHSVRGSRRNCEAGKPGHSRGAGDTQSNRDCRRRKFAGLIAFRPSPFPFAFRFSPDDARTRAQTIKRLPRRTGSLFRYVVPPPLTRLRVSLRRPTLHTRRPGRCRRAATAHQGCRPS